jgi:hypothetical protein
MQLTRCMAAEEPTMKGYWLTFTDGSKGYCEGQNPYDAVKIAQKLTGKIVVHENEGDKYTPELKSLPYPADPIIWQFDHPVNGKCPAFCFQPNSCAGRTACPRPRACDD